MLYQIINNVFVFSAFYAVKFFGFPTAKDA